MDLTDVDIDPGSLTVVQVYEIAARIGRDFESIIETHGQDAVTGLMPKVVKVLELMETLAERNERETKQVNELRIEVAKLKSTALMRDEQYIRREKVQVNEDTYRDEESRGLIKVLDQLKLDNEELRNALIDHEKMVEEGSVALKQQEAINKEELALLHTLKDTVVKQRDQLRNQEKEIEQSNIDCDALQLQVDRLATVNEDLRRKMQMIQSHTKSIIEEKVLSQKQLDTLKNRYNLNNNYEHEELQKSDQENVSPNNIELTENEISVDLKGKMIIDLTDPERPRYTKQDLQKVLLERDGLHVKVSELEEELTIYKDDFVVPPVPADSAKKPSESGIRRIFGVFSRSKSPVPAAVTPHNGSDSLTT